MIHIVGLGAGDESQLTLGVYRLLQSGMPLYLRTKEHPVVSFLEATDISYTSFDDVYMSHESFEAVYEEIIETVKQKGAVEDIIFAVPGHPCVAEYTVKRLVLEAGARVIGGQSFLDPMFAALNIDPIDGLQVMDALDFNYEAVSPSQNLIIPQVFDQLVASDLKLDLLEVYDAEYEICVVRAAGGSQEQLNWMKLYELDHNFKLDNLTTVFVPKLTDNK